MANANEFIKDPYVKTVFKNQKELDDFVKCCDPNTGYLYFMDNFFYIQHPTKGSMLYHPYEYQKRLIDTYHNNRYSIALMPRQSGKCFGINTIVKLKNTNTNIIEEITIGEFYDRFSKMSDLPNRNERTPLSSFSQTQHDGHALQKFISQLANSLRKSASSKLFEYVRGKKSSISAWWKTLPILKKIYARRHSGNYPTQSGNQQKKKWLPHHIHRILVKKDRRGYREGFGIIDRKTENIFVRKMHSALWRRRGDETLEYETAKMVEKFQETKFFCDLSKIVQSNYGNLPIYAGLLCYPQSRGYERLQEQRISVNINFWQDYFTGLYRHIKKENNRIRWDILAWTNEGEYKERTRTRKRYNNKWVSITQGERRRFYKEPDSCSREMFDISNRVERKFVESYNVCDYEVMTDTGWEKISDLHLTVPYYVYKLETESGLTLECADTHILFDENMNQVFVKDLKQNSLIQTTNGIDKIKYVEKTDKQENMFDITVESKNHRFYTNNILSHNTTSAAGYLLWFGMFVPDSTILIAAHKYTGAQEIMQRIRYAYENCPMHIKAGVATYNKGSLFFDNGSRIVSATTTENTGRGMSITLLYLDEFAFVRPTMAEQFWTSITPTLATGGKAIITSTPNSDEDQFALIWKGANKCEDEYGNKTEVGVNGFKAYRSYWTEQPGRDEKWAEQMKSQLGVDRFSREIGCFSQDTTLKIKDQSGKVFEVSMKELEKILNGNK
jgi:Terminase large subunit, T4likevirus-type, N-terminal